MRKHLNYMCHPSVEDDIKYKDIFTSPRNDLTCKGLTVYKLDKISSEDLISRHGPLARYVKLQVAHVPGMLGTFSPAADFKGNC